MFIGRIKKSLLCIFLVALVFVNSTNLSAKQTNSQMVSITGGSRDYKIVSLIKNQLNKNCYGYNYYRNDNFDDYSFNINPLHRNSPCQSLTHLKKIDNNNDPYAFYYLQNTVKNIGNARIEKITNRALSEEIKKQDSHYVFYHGQPLEFLLFQDIFNFLHKTLSQKALKKFIALRLPTDDLTNYPNVHAFLSDFNNLIDDSQDPARKLLLSVTPTFFGVNMPYFLNSSSAFYIDRIELIQKAFDFFKALDLFEKHKEEIIAIQENLAEYHKEKTGLLVQIFVPKTLADKISYKSHPGGTPFNHYAPTKATDDLEASKKDPTILDQQFRLFLNPNLFSQENITMLRYYNKTPNTKKYKQAISNLFKKMAKDINEKK